MEQYLDLSKGKLRLLKIGEGPRLMLGLHGFAQTADYFQYFAPDFFRHFTLYAIDLPFHGKTIWQHYTYDQTDVLEWVQLILQKENEQKCYLIGHSLGARIWLSCLPQLQSRITAACLLAPDGLVTKHMSLPELMPTWGRRVLARGLKNPGWLLRMANWLHQQKMLSAFSNKYLQYHFKSKERQARLLKTWQALGNFNVNLNVLRKSLALNSQMNLSVILGEDDPLIPADQFQKVAKTIPEMEVIMLPYGHQLINKEVVKTLIRWTVGENESGAGLAK